VSAVQVWLREVLRHAGEAQSRERRVEHLDGAVVDELAVDAHFEFAAGFFEFPRVQPAVGWQAQVDAVVLGQVLRFLGRGALGEVRRRADDGHAHVRSDAHRDHVLRHLLAEAHAGARAGKPQFPIVVYLTRSSVERRTAQPAISTRASLDLAKPRA